jgi:hypothetical protein
MMLLGILSKYSWGDFLTFLFAVDGIILAFGFALNQFVWSKESGLTKNERRSQREEKDDEVERRDYRRLSESVTDYNEVKSVDDSFDTDDSMPYGGEEDNDGPSRHTSNIADQLVVEDDDETNMEDHSHVEEPVLDEEDATAYVSDEEIEENNNLAEEKFLSEEEGCEVIADDSFEEVNNREYLVDEEGEAIYATSPQEELTDVQLLDENDEPYTISADDMMGLEDAVPYDLPVMEDPEEEEEPSFDAD